MHEHKLLLKRSYFTLIVLFTLFFSACEDGIFQRGISEGKIEYDISYPNVPEDDIMLDLMPKSMKTTFVDNNFRSEITAGMGIFKTSVIRKEGNDKLIHSIKMLKTKYASELTAEDFQKFSPGFNALEVTMNSETKEIAGYHCKGADIKVLGDSTWGFKVFYTDDIALKNVNLYTPYQAIDGVLMEYEVLSNNILMRFTATKVMKEEVEMSAIELDESYEMVDPMKLKSEIEKLFANIM